MSPRPGRRAADGGGQLTLAPRTSRSRMRGEKGFVIAMTGLLLVPLLIFTAFAVDLGSWYAQGARMQRAIDAAALAGVVQLPNQANATAAADQVLLDNGFDPTKYTHTYSFPPGAGETMIISLSAPGKQYFSQLVLSSEKLTRTATAVYNLRIPLGSPANEFGNDPVGGVTPNLWAAINGPYSNHADGDAYSVKCAVGSAAGSSTTCDGSGSNIPPLYGGTNANGTYRPTGFLWAVDVPASALNSPITVSIYDPSFGPNSALSEGTSGANGVGFATSYQLFNTTGASAAIDTSSANGMNTLGRCTGGTPGYQVFAAGSTVGQNAWWALCTFTPTVAGLYPLQVKTSAIPGVTDQGGGFNAYSLKAVSSGGNQPSLYALNDLSIWTPQPGTAKFYLANIGPQYAGHTLVVDMYDPGDGSSGNYFLSILRPPAGAPANPPTGGTSIGCNYSPPTALIGGATTLTSATCTIQTRNSGTSPANIYNNNWLRIAITIPANYTCTTDCWWTVNYNFSAGSSPTDRTVWVVNVLGDPVHLTQ